MGDDHHRDPIQPLQQQQQVPPPPHPPTFAEESAELLTLEERRERLREMLQAEGYLVREELMNAPDPHRASRGAGLGLNRFIDARLPLWGVLTAMAALAMVLITMWFNVQQLTAGQVETQRLLREAMNSANSQERELVRLAGRQEQMEETIRDQRLRMDSLFNQMTNLARSAK